MFTLLPALLGVLMLLIGMKLTYRIHMFHELKLACSFCKPPFLKIKLPPYQGHIE